MLDIITITLLVIGFIRGYRKGLIITLFSMAAVVIGVLLALKLSSVLAGYLFSQGWVSSGWASVLSYVLIFVAVAYAIKLGGRAIERAMDAVSLGWLNRMAGGAFSTFTIAFVWSAFLWLAYKVGALGPETIAVSKTYSFISPIAPWVLGKIGLILPFVKDMMQQLQLLSDKLTNSLSPGVDTP